MNLLIHQSLCVETVAFLPKIKWTSLDLFVDTTKILTNDAQCHPLNLP
jgi:hypothetical protein